MESLNLRHPLIVAPMAGGPSSIELVAASCNAGALGSVGAAYSSPQDMEKFVLDLRKKTTAPFAMNLFIPSKVPTVSEKQIQDAIQATDKFRAEFHLPTPQLAAPYEEDFDAQFEMVLKLKPKVFSFVFGLLSADKVLAAKKQNIFLIGTATSLEEAQALQASGIDAITLQGYEAGGHRGIFNAESEDPQIFLKDLLAQCRDKIQLPLIAAGGIMNHVDVETYLSNGAQAVQMGTAFLTCLEAGTSGPYRRALQGRHRQTKTTRAFSGRFARGIENQFMQELDQKPQTILPFPIQNKFTRDIRSASAKKDSSAGLSLWAGSGYGELWTGSAAGLISSLFND